MSPIFKISALGTYSENYGISDKSARAFAISKTFNWVWHPGLPHSLNSFGIPRQDFGLIATDGKFVNASIP